MLKMLQKDGFVEGYEVQIKRTDGTVIWVIFSIVVMELSGEKVILGALYDISERKQAEKEIEDLARFPGENPVDSCGSRLVPDPVRPGRDVAGDGSVQSDPPPYLGPALLHGLDRTMGHSVFPGPSIC